MAKSPSQIYIFGNGKVNVREFVFFNCQLSSQKDSKIEVSRAFFRFDLTALGNQEPERELFGIELEKSVATATISFENKSVHLRNIFLTSALGLSIKFENESDSFALRSDESPNDFLKMTTPDGQTVALQSFIDAIRVL